jgi:hypothetical protein
MKDPVSNGFLQRLVDKLDHPCRQMNNFQRALGDALYTLCAWRYALCVIG